MKFAAFALIASLCWAVVSAGVISNILARLHQSQDLYKSRVKCTVDEVSKMNDAIKTLPDFSACDGELSKDLAKRREEIVKTSSEINDIYENHCKDGASIGCFTKILGKGIKLAVEGCRFVKLLNQVNDAPADVQKCLKNDIQPHQELLKKAVDDVKACFSKK